jgi:hypothetical protein
VRGGSSMRAFVRAREGGGRLMHYEKAPVSDD